MTDLFPDLHTKMSQLWEEFNAIPETEIEQRDRKREEYLAVQQEILTRTEPEVVVDYPYNEEEWKKKLAEDKIDPILFKIDGKFSPPHVAAFFLERYDLLTLSDTDEILYYQDGIYHPGGEVLIKGLCVSLFKDTRCFTTHVINEILNHIRWSTYTDRGNLDTRLDLICLENGILNLHTRERLDFDPSYRFTARIPVRYDKTASCPAVEKFISEVVDAVNIPAVYEWIGYCLYRKYPIQKALMCVGEGDNGKSKLLGMVIRFLGKENVSAVPIQKIGDRFSTASLFGKMANVFPDISYKALEDTSIFKMATGEDMIEAEQKFKGPFRFFNYAKMLYSCNRLPQSFDDTVAFFKRWYILNFPNIFSRDTADRNILEKITTPTELSGLLNRALDGLDRLLKNGEFTNAISPGEMEDKYKRMSDPVYAFCMDRLEVSYDSEVVKSVLYGAFADYCRKNGYPVLSDTKFFSTLPHHMAVNTTRPTLGDKRQVCYKGIRLIGEVNPEKNDEQYVKAVNLFPYLKRGE